MSEPVVTVAISASGRKLNAEGSSNSPLWSSIVKTTSERTNERTNKDQGEKKTDLYIHGIFWVCSALYVYVRAGRYIIFCGPKGWDRTVASKALDDFGDPMPRYTPSQAYGI
jgi:hypothetical protein